ncbi:hypothetical protein [Larkinella soli]|uniref:hypothetical protein n=1 Tax=Larkinella soli TaxID=1770527 RepID=UPI001E5E2782
MAVGKAEPAADTTRKTAGAAPATPDTTEKDPLKADSLRFAGDLPDTILPKYRILAYYGNPHSKKMGILGEYPLKEMLRRLDEESENWAKADPSKPVQKALHLVAISAQGAPGKDGKYRLRMSDKTIRKVISWGARHGAIVFLDIQVGLADLKGEMAFLEKYLKLPYVHLGIDPEFSMKTGARPGTRIGTYDASDINDAVRFLSRVKKENNLPPKILIVHRFTQRMVTNYKNIKLDPNVQIVMNMDGWGPPSLKRDSYQDYIVKEPVQYTGFKIFYKNDMKKVDLRSNHKVPHLMEPEEVLALDPKPIYIQYQ